jgi:hypothetical protein
MTRVFLLIARDEITSLLHSYLGGDKCSEVWIGLSNFAESTGNNGELGAHSQHQLAHGFLIPVLGLPNLRLELADP